MKDRSGPFPEGSARSLIVRSMNAAGIAQHG